MEDVVILESEGVTVSIDVKIQHIFGSLATISADNLTSHEIEGFRMCFNSGRICRFCTVGYDEMTHLVSETSVNYPKLRSTLEHAKHVSAVLSDSTLASVYGVTRKVALHSLIVFDSTTSLPPDCM